MDDLQHAAAALAAGFVASGDVKDAPAAAKCYFECLAALKAEKAIRDKKGGAKAERKPASKPPKVARAHPEKKRRT